MQKWNQDNFCCLIACFIFWGELVHQILPFLTLNPAKHPKTLWWSHLLSLWSSSLCRPTTQEEQSQLCSGDPWSQWKLLVEWVEFLVKVFDHSPVLVLAEGDSMDASEVDWGDFCSRRWAIDVGRHWWKKWRNPDTIYRRRGKKVCASQALRDCFEAWARWTNFSSRSK